MTKSLAEAFEIAASLPESDQDFIAELILHELASEERWRVQFQNSQRQLSILAAEASEEYSRGRTLPLEPDSL